VLSEEVTVIKIPKEDTISVDWFNACFAEAGLNGRISGFDAARVGTGQIGKCVRYTFAFADQGDLPASVIGKFLPTMRTVARRVSPC
jgi:hypothetical protein